MQFVLRRRTLIPGVRARVLSVFHLAPAFTLFAVGAACQYFADVLLAARASPDQLVLWTQLKPLMLIVGGMGLLGLEQVLVREPSSPVPIVKLALGAAAVAAVALGAIGAWVGSISLGVGVSAAGFMFAVSTLIFSSARSRGQLLLAHMGRDGWKIAFLGFCLISLAVSHPINVLVLLVLSFVCGTIPFVFGMSRKATGAKQHSQDVDTIASALRIGFPFCVSAISLTIGSYGELLVLNAFAPDEAVRAYFKAALAFAYPALMVNTFLAGTLSVRVRDNPSILAKVSRVPLGVALAVVCCLTALLFSAGFVVARGVGLHQENMLVVGLALSFSGAVRLAAVVSTSGLGVIAPRAILDRLAGLYLGGSLIMIGAMAAMLLAGAKPAISAALCVAAYWTFRLVTAQIYSRQVTDAVIPMEGRPNDAS